MKHLKKLAMVIAGLWCCMAVNAHDFEVDGIYYDIYKTKRVEVTFKGSSYFEYSDEYAGKVEIPESVTYNGKTYSVTSIGDYAFYGCKGLTSITIPSSVASIGEWAFRDCKGITSITIPNSVTSIGRGAFWNCSGLTSITIPNSVKTIGEWAFRDCKGITSIAIPNSVTSIGNKAFYGCDGLTSITIPSSVKTIGDQVFYGCDGLTSITIPSSVTSIGEEAFQWCTGLASITIPNSVTSIGSSAFSDCTGLTSITIPNSVTSIGSSAFSDCTGLTSITIPNSVKTIGEYAFYGCEGLKTVINYSSLDIFAGYSFHGFVAYYADKVITADRQIGDFFFYQTALVGYVGSQSELVLPEDYNGKKYMIGPGAFGHNTHLTSVFIPASVTSIGMGAFFGCTGLTSITIPNSVTWIGEEAFDGCTGLKTVINCSSLDISAGYSGHGFVAYYADKVITADRQIGDFFFYQTALVGYVGSQSELALPEDYNGEKYMIGPSAFRDNKNLTSVFIPASVTGIEENAFNGCGNLASLTMASPVPPASVYENSFGTINYIYTTLYVPEGSLAAYQTADVWKYFLEIKEYDPTGIENVVLDTESSNLPVYNLQGVRMKDMDNLPSGIYIQGGKKFIVK